MRLPPANRSMQLPILEKLETVSVLVMLPTVRTWGTRAGK